VDHPEQAPPPRSENPTEGSTTPPSTVEAPPSPSSGGAEGSTQEGASGGTSSGTEGGATEGQSIDCSSQKIEIATRLSQSDDSFEELRGEAYLFACDVQSRPETPPAVIYLSQLAMGLAALPS
jgi:hypothetical protein